MSRRAAGNFLKAYEEYSSELEAPATFHLWVALSIMGSALRRNVYIDQGVYKAYPNLYVILCAPAGKIGKSVCIRHGRSILTAVPEVQLGPDAITAEDLVRWMARAGKDSTSSAITIHSSELSSLIDPSGLKMIQFLTDIYDCEDNPHGWRRSTKTQGRDTIKNPVLNILAGTTPDWVAESMPIQATSHGFTSRTLFVFEDRVRFANPRPSAPDPKLVEALQTDLQHIAKIEGPFEWTKSAENLYDEYYKEWMLNDPFDHRIAGYYHRKRTHVLKVAQLIHLAESDSLVIEERDIRTAVRALELIEEGMPRTFSGMGKYEHTADLDRIWTQIAKNGGMKLSDVFDRNYMVGNSEDVYRLIRTLAAMSRVTIVKEEGESWVRPIGDRSKRLGERPHRTVETLPADQVLETNHSQARSETPEQS